jgi:hypothetical protein
MCVAIIFCAEPEQERGQNKKRHSFFGRSEEKSLPQTIEFKTPVCFQLARTFGVNSSSAPFAAAERVMIGNFL